MDAIEALTTRASAKAYGDMTPTRDHLDVILQAAVHAPDHGRLRPWRFMLIQGAQRAPLIILVACRVVPGTKVPVIEQILAAGAAAQNILLGLHNFGYVAAWKTGDAAYDPEVKKALGLQVDDHIVGFIYAGGGLGALFAPGKPAVLEDALLSFPG